MKRGAGAVGAQLVHPDGRLQNSIHAFPGIVTELFPIVLLELFELADIDFPDQGRDILIVLITRFSFRDRDLIE